MLYKKLDYSNPETQAKIEELIRDSLKIVVGESNDGCNMNDTFLNLDLNWAINTKQSTLSLEDLE